MTLRRWIGVIAVGFGAVGFAVAAGAAQFARGDMRALDPWSRPLPPVATVGAAYVVLYNDGGAADAVTGATSEIAERVEVHEHVMSDGMMRMRQVHAVPLPPGERVSFEPGGLHFMLFSLKQPLKEGARFRLTLQFEKAGDLDVEVEVRQPR